MGNILTSIDAGKALAKEVDLAYQTNKDSNFTIQVECGTRMNMGMTVNEVLTIAKLEEVAELIPRKALFFVRPSIGSLFYVDFPQRAEAYRLETQWNDRVLTLDFVIYGTSSDFRWQYEYNYYAKKNLQDLLTRTEGLSEMAKLSEVVTWILEKIEVKLGVSTDEIYVSQQLIWDNTAIGDDEVLAEAFLYFASLVGIDTDHYLCPKEVEDWNYDEKPFFWNVVKIEGREYCLDMVEISDFYRERKEENGVVHSLEKLLIPVEKVEQSEEYQVWSPLWIERLPFSNVSPA